MTHFNLIKKMLIAALLLVATSIPAFAESSISGYFFINDQWMRGTLITNDNVDLDIGQLKVNGTWLIKNDAGDVIVDKQTGSEKYQTETYQFTTYLLNSNIMIFIGRGEITLKADSEFDTAVYDINGRVVYSSTGEKQLNIPASTFSDEQMHYILTVTDKSGSTSTMQIMKNGENIMATQQHSDVK